MKFGNGVVALAAVGFLMAGMYGCQKQEGPAERAGREIDKTMEKVGKSVEKAGEKIQDTAKGAK
jgi:hypothetical protein